MNEKSLIDAMLLLRTLLYPVAAYGFFLLATYRPSQEVRGHRLMRQSCYALSAFFLLAAYKTAVLFTHTGTALADTLLTPALMVIIGLVYAGVIYLSRDRGHNGVSPGSPAKVSRPGDVSPGSPAKVSRPGDVPVRR